MKLFLLSVICLSNLTQLYSQCADTSNIYKFTYNGKNYEVIKEIKSWNNAAACATERGGYLVEINNTDEQNAVYDAIINGALVSPTYTSISNGGGIAYVWTGATDKQIEGTWIWDGNNDGNGLHFWTGQGNFGSGGGAAVNNAFFNWGGTSTGNTQEPDNYGSGQHHAAIALTGWPAGTTMLGIAGEWNDIIGSSQLYYVVELGNTTGMQFNSDKPKVDLSVYPNPTNGILNFNTFYDSIEIYDFSGKLLKQFKNIKSIDVAELEKGAYILQTYKNSIVNYGKFILN